MCICLYTILVSRIDNYNVERNLVQRGTATGNQSSDPSTCFEGCLSGLRCINDILRFIFPYITFVLQCLSIPG